MMSSQLGHTIKFYGVISDLKSPLTGKAIDQHAIILLDGWW